MIGFGQRYWKTPVVLKNTNPEKAGRYLTALYTGKVPVRSA